MNDQNNRIEKNENELLSLIKENYTQGNYQEAEKYAKEATRRFRDNGELWYRFGHVCLRLKEYHEATMKFIVAAYLSKGKIQVDISYFYATYCAYKSDDYLLAIRLGQSVSKTDEGIWAETIATIAICNHALNHYGKAIELIDSVLKPSNDNDLNWDYLMYIKASSFLNLNDTKNALSTLKLLLDKNPSNQLAILLKATIENKKTMNYYKEFP